MESESIKKDCLNNHLNIDLFTFNDTSYENYCTRLLHTIRIKRYTTKCFSVHFFFGFVDDFLHRQPYLKFKNGN